MSTAESVARLVPHQGAMCLNERVLDWDERRIRLATATHRATSNPLRSRGRLHAVHLCEYGAQAMAAHGGLRAEAAGSSPAPGMLVSLRGVRFGRRRVDDLPGDLIVEAECLLESDSSLQYEFRVSHEGEVLASGRAAVMLRAGG